MIYSYVLPYDGTLINEKYPGSDWASNALGSDTFFNISVPLVIVDTDPVPDVIFVEIFGTDALFTLVNVIDPDPAAIVDVNNVDGAIVFVKPATTAVALWFAIALFHFEIKLPVTLTVSVWENDAVTTPVIFDGIVYVWLEPDVK